MKKTKLPVILALALVLVFLFSFAGTAENVQPGITIDEVSLRMSNEGNLGLRFISDVQLPLPDGARITEQGTLIVPLYVNGYEEFTLSNVSPDGPVKKVPKTENKIYSKQDNSYQFATVLEDIPEYHLKSPICARSFITYTVGEESNTVYSEIEIYDAYSLAEAGSDVLTQYDAYIASVANNEDSATLTITAPAAGEVVYPYADDAKAYLQTTDEVSKTGSESALSAYVNYQGKFTEVCKGIDITWTDTVGAKSYTVMYATKEDYSDAKFAWSTAEDCKVSLYNLYKGTTYYVKIIANGNELRTVETTFVTTDLGPRVIYLNGPHNARDLGGYDIKDAEGNVIATVNQGLLYRSGRFDAEPADDNTEVSNVNTAISDFGRYLVRTDLEVKTELDLRPNYSQALECENYFKVRMLGYDLANTDTHAALRYIFEILANEDNYPIVFHCQGGADRTGTVAYLVNALLGVSDLDLAHDYEFTSHSYYGLRHMNSVDYIAMSEYKFFETLDEAYPEGTTQQKVEAYLLNTVGVDPDHIANVKSIMLTGQPVTTQE